MAEEQDVTETRRSPSPSPITTDNNDELDISPLPQASIESSPKITRTVQHSPRRSPRRRDITATLEDGTTITIPENMLDQLTMATRGPSSSCIYTHVIAVDAGFGCVEVVAGAKKCICFIAHIKNVHSLFPKKDRHRYDASFAS